MILYFMDRSKHILGNASTVLGGTYIVVDDTKKEDVDAGVSSFEGRIFFQEADRLNITELVKGGNIILRYDGDEYKRNDTINKDDQTTTQTIQSHFKINGFKDVFTIVETEVNTQEQTIYFYAEDGGLDLLNDLASPLSGTNRGIEYYVTATLQGTGFGLKNHISDPDMQTLSLNWDNSQPVIQRLKEIASKFEYEFSFGFDIVGMSIVSQWVDFVKERGTNTEQVLAINRRVNNILVKESIANLATAILPIGADNLSLDGFSYDDGEGDIHTAGLYLVSEKALKDWGRYAFTNGSHIYRSFSCDAITQQDLLDQALVELKKRVVPEVNYDVDISDLPDGVGIGDRINIVDDNAELYISGRILKLETSVVQNSKKATLGEYLIRNSGISDRVKALAAQAALAQEKADDAKEIADNTYIYDHDYTITTPQTRSGSGNKIAHFTAHVYRGGVEVTDLFSDENFTWFYKTEEGEFPVATPNTGKEIDVAISDMSYGGHIIGYFNNDENDATLQTANYRALETYNNKKLLARASTDEVRVRDLSKTTVISVSDEILVVNSADEKLASVSNLADAVWSKYAITIEGEPLNQGNNVYEDLGLLSITNSELENILVL